MRGGGPPSWLKGKSPGLPPVRQTTHQVGKRKKGDDRKASFQLNLFAATEGFRDSQPGQPLSKQQNGEGPSGARTSAGGMVMSLRQVTTIISADLQTVHPNPGPSPERGRRGRRGKTAEHKEARRERRHNKRKDRAKDKKMRNSEGERSKKGYGTEKEIVTWNVQRLSMNQNNRQRLRRVIGRIIKEKWEIVLLSEIRAEEDNVIWFDERDGKVAVIHSKKAAIVLRGETAQIWIEEGQKKWFEDRVVAVVIGGIRYVSVYQPVWGTDEEGMQGYRKAMENQLALTRKEKIIIGGDFNANVGKNEARRRVSGKYGTGNSSEAGKDLLEWCEENGMAYVNSFIKHRRRGTWFHPRYGRWYELDGFIVRQEERHRLVKKMTTRNEGGLSDHRPKVVKIIVGGRRWRTEGGKEGKKSKIRWEVLKDTDKSIQYKERTRELLARMEENTREGQEWKDLAGVMVTAARQVCGETTRRVENPWMIGHEEELDRMTNRVIRAVERKNIATEKLQSRKRLRVRRNDRIMAELEAESNATKEEVKTSRKAVKKFCRRLEKEWWEERIVECKDACDEGRVGDMYRSLKKIGTRGKKEKSGTTITMDEFKRHFEKVSRDRYEIEPSKLEEAIEGTKDLRYDARAIEANATLNTTPTRNEILEAIKEIRESAPGEDEVRIGYIKMACEEIEEKVIILVQEMFKARANKWDDLLKVGIIVPLFKKGDRNEAKNYRGVCLLAMGSRVLARVVSKRIGWWAEHLELLDENQAGFRKGRSTADVAQIVIRIQEDVEDCKRREEGKGTTEEGEWPEARLLDLEKAYPRVSKPAMWKLLERYGMKGECLDTLKDLHEGTEYKVRGREGLSQGWMPARGLREGCSTSPILFNIFHQAVMRQAEEKRRMGSGDVGVTWKWVPGSSLAGTAIWEKGSGETKEVRISDLLFADDTTVVGKKKEIGDGVNIVKEVMGGWEERTNESKEEILEFGTASGEEIRVLGSWVGTKADIKNRIKRAGSLWGRVKSWLKGSKMSKRSQGRVVEACVESSLLYDSQVRVWYSRDINKLQKWVDKCYRYVWSDRNGEPLRLMERKGMNMQDVRRCLRVKSLRWKIEKRVLERIGHVLRMGNERLTKAVVLGWYEGLEGKEKMKGRKKKTILYWKKLLKEAGIDWTDIQRLTADREGWRKIVKGRFSHLEKWENQQGHKYEWGIGEERIERNVKAEKSLRCRYEGCGKVCKSRAGLTMHEKRLHREGMTFKCNKCNITMKTEGAKTNHERTCYGGEEEPEEQGDKRRCGLCGKQITKPNYARHIRSCQNKNTEAAQNERERMRETERERAGQRGNRGKVRRCGSCGGWLSAANMARHQRSCMVWDPGGGPSS